MKNFILLALAFLVISCQSKAEPEVVEKPAKAEYVKKLYNAFAEGDVETVMAGFAEDIEWNEAENFIYSDGNPYVGGAAIGEGVFARLGSEWEYWNLENLQFLNVDTNMVLATGRYKALNKASGKELDAQFAHLWTLRDSLVSSFQQYTDTKQAAEAVVADME
ncbi:nuclear transport factor 2 family protein [Flavobacteriaceae bacterium D16]|nr:nuclear transport factor 2 family protein [Flavobacteriaceae bacterium D16]